jgi:hypothetical protein
LFLQDEQRRGFSGVGKFAQRLQLPKTEYLTEEEELHEKLCNSTIEIKEEFMDLILETETHQG